jgi:hypothetical protein
MAQHDNSSVGPGGARKIAVSKKRGGRARKNRGGMMTSMRGGFRSAVKGVTGGNKNAPAASSTKRFLSNLITLALVIAAVVLLLRRFGVL